MRKVKASYKSIILTPLYFFSFFLTLLESIVDSGVFPARVVSAQYDLTGSRASHIFHHSNFIKKIKKVFIPSYITCHEC